MNDLDRLAQAARDVQQVSAFRLGHVIHVHHQPPRQYSPLQWGFGVGLGLILAWLAVVLIMWILGVGLFAAATAVDAVHRGVQEPPQDVHIYEQPPPDKSAHPQ
jgi:hypothetical protein